MAQQNRAWEFDLEEGILDPARLSRVVTDPYHPLSFMHEKEATFRDTVVTLLLDNSGSMRGRPDHGRGDLRRHSGAHAGALRRQGRDSRLHHARLEGRAVARGVACRRQAGQSRPPQRSPPHHLQVRRRAVAARAEKSRPDDARGPAQGEHRRRGAGLGAQAAARPLRAAQDPDDDLRRRAGRRLPRCRSIPATISSAICATSSRRSRPARRSS